MSQVSFDCSRTEVRNRGTVAARIILAIPQLIVLRLWNAVAEIVAIIHWFICVFTGRRNASMWKFVNDYLMFESRTLSYVALMHDEWPPIGNDQGSVPTRYELAYDDSVNRKTVALRIIWVIPALVIGMLYGIGAFFVAIASWFAIVVTGSQPPGMFDFLLKASRYLAQVNAYLFLQTDTYPATSGPASPPAPGVPVPPVSQF